MVQERFKKFNIGENVNIKQKLVHTTRPEITSMVPPSHVQHNTVNTNQWSEHQVVEDSLDVTIASTYNRTALTSIQANFGELDCT
ncbi:hypothetical protein LR48_Vigan07g181200 [Vigna angularis]|uniref:Uncharacterized protein n=1 Tax=Phaseolus angularis TaxID=3914 RepID=A0A0L9UZA7_PHAAN|nr:hypothetical protein LR48_Vigan07g181200 [Vigna angularis]